MPWTGRTGRRCTVKAQSGKSNAARVVRQRKDPDPTPPPDYEDWKRSQAMSLSATRQAMEKRRKKKA
jgi:hypothetical protein